MSGEQAQDSVSDVERVARIIAGLCAGYDHIARDADQAREWKDTGAPEWMWRWHRGQFHDAASEIIAALAVPINKIGEDARTYDDGVEDAAKLVEAYDTFSGTPCCDAVRDVMAVELAEQVRRLSTSTDKGVR